MKLWEFFEQQAAKFADFVHQQDLMERIWSCEPLLVIDENDTVVYEGNTDVDVTPVGADRANLVAATPRDGWVPTLVDASVTGFSSGGGYSGGSRNGIICRGRDADGNVFTWYINGAADDHFAWILRSDELEVAPPEDLVPKRIEPR